MKPYSGRAPPAHSLHDPTWLVYTLGLRRTWAHLCARSAQGGRRGRYVRVKEKRGETNTDVRGRGKEAKDGKYRARCTRGTSLCVQLKATPTAYLNQTDRTRDCLHLWSRWPVG